MDRFYCLKVHKYRVELYSMPWYSTVRSLYMQAYSSELKACLTSGSLHLGETAGQRKDWVTNPTLLHPDSGAWEVHYHASPYPSFTPFAQEEVLGSNRSDPHNLARVGLFLSTACMLHKNAFPENKGWCFD